MCLLFRGPASFKLLLSKIKDIINTYLYYYNESLLYTSFVTECGGFHLAEGKAQTSLDRKAASEK